MSPCCSSKKACKPSALDDTILPPDEAPRLAGNGANNGCCNVNDPPSSIEITSLARKCEKLESGRGKCCSKEGKVEVTKTETPESGLKELGGNKSKGCCSKTKKDDSIAQPTPAVTQGGCCKGSQPTLESCPPLPATEKACGNRLRPRDDIAAVVSTKNCYPIPSDQPDIIDRVILSPLDQMEQSCKTSQPQQTSDVVVNTQYGTNEAPGIVGQSGCRSGPAVPKAASGCCASEAGNKVKSATSCCVAKDEPTSDVENGCCGASPFTSNGVSTDKEAGPGYCTQDTLTTCRDTCCGAESDAAPSNACYDEMKTVSDDGCCRKSSGTDSPTGCCAGQAAKETKVSYSATGIRKRRGTTRPKQADRVKPKDETMCPCCVQSMLTTNTSSLDVVMSRVVEAQERFKRCCIAFADLCCARSRTDTGCCERPCSETDGRFSKIESVCDKGEKGSGSEKTHHGGEEEVNIPAISNVDEIIVLEVIGMDCPDCLSKVTRAVQVLDGAEVKNADGVRGLVKVSYDPRKIDLKAIQTFAARASGFTINVLGEREGDDGAKVLLLPLEFERMPPASVLDSWDHSPVRAHASTKFGWWRDAERGEAGGGSVDLSLPLDSAEPIKPREVLASLAPYGARIRPHMTDSNQTRINRDIRNISLRTLAALVLTIPILVLVWSPPALASPTVSHSIQLALATLIIGVAWPVYAGSFRSAYYLHRADLGVLTSFSTLTSYIFSGIAFGFEVAGRDIGAPFFETVGLLITLIFAGRTLQASTRRLGLRAVDNLGRLQPDTARLLSDGKEEDLDIRLLHYDDIIRVMSGEIVPTDGVLIRGSGTIDESSLTGEAIPVTKTRGSTLTAGTTLIDGQVDMVVTRLLPENSISTIMDAVSSSSTSSEYQDLADRMAGWLLPIAGTCCLAAFVGWMLVERLRRGEGWGKAIITGVGYAIAIAAVSCPCALAIAVTLVTSISMATTVQDGVLFRSTQALLTAHSIRAIAFDKTGTLSQGTMTVHESSYDQDPLSVRLIHAVTATNKHPVSETAKRYIEAEHDLTLEPSSKQAAFKGLDDIEEVPGKGIKASFFGFAVVTGSPAFTDTSNHPLVREYLANGLTILVITLGRQLVAIFGMKDRPREGVHDLIADLGIAGKQISLVSGDNDSAVHAFAREVGIPSDLTYASQTPVSKGQVVLSLKEIHHPRRIAFVGDGINDTIALANADISIATGSASNASSQIIILSSDVPRAMREILSTSWVTRNHVMASLALCGVYFVVAILLASGVTGWRIPPAYAGLGELVSILPVLMVGGHLAVLKSVKRWLGARRVQG